MIAPLKWLRGQPRLQLFVRIVSLESRKLMSYRADFWVNAFASFFTQLAVAYFVWLAVFAASGSERLGGFTFQGMVLYYVFAVLLGKIVRGQERDISMSQDIYEGSLTKYLLYPCTYFWFKYAEHLGSLAPALVQLVLLGGVSAFVLEPGGEFRITLASIVMTGIALAAANLMSFLIVYPAQGVAFWADNVWTLNVMVRFTGELLGGLMLPLSLFPAWAQQILAWTPFPYLFYFPVMTLVGRVGPLEWLQGVGVSLIWCVAIGALGRLVWKRGYLTYTGVGI